MEYDTSYNNVREHLMSRGAMEKENLVMVPATWVRGLMEWAKRMEERERHVLVGVLYKLELNHLLRYILEGEQVLQKKQVPPDYRVVFCNRCADGYVAFAGEDVNVTLASQKNPISLS